MNCDFIDTVMKKMSNIWINLNNLISDKEFAIIKPSLIVVAVLSSLFFLSWICRKILKKAPIFSGFQKYSIVTFLSTTFLFFKLNSAEKGLGVRIIDSVFSFAKIFTFNLSAGEIIENYEKYKLETVKDYVISDVLRLYINIISIAVLLCTAFAIFALISKILNDTVVQLKYYFKIGESYIFSEINEKSACLANDIREKNKHAQIIFAGVNKSELNKEELDYLNSFSGGKVNTTSRPITNFHLTKFRKTNVYLIDEEEKNNVKNGKTIFENNKKYNAIINIFSPLRSAETIINSIDKNNSNATINLINPAQIIAYDTLWKHPMFESAERCGSDTMNVMVVGAGYIGMECAKAAMWCGIMDSFKFKINIVDKEDREKEFDAQFPDFKKNADEAGIPVDYKFHKADVTTSDFTNVLEKCSDTNYIIVAIGDDEITMNTTIAIRKWFVRKAVNEGQYNPEKVPTIIPIIRNSDYRVLAEILSDSKHESDKDKKKCKIFKRKRKIENSKADDYIYPIGSNADVYKQNVIDEWTIERLAEIIHNKYCEARKEKNESVIDYKDLVQTRKRSSRSSAVHSLYKLKDAGIVVDMTDNAFLRKVSDSYTIKAQQEQDAVIESIMYVEHGRWLIFQLLDGWVPIDVEKLKAIYPDRSDKNREYHKISDGMMHGTIVHYDALNKVDEELYSSKKQFKSNDKMIVEYIVKDMLDEVKVTAISLKKGTKI